MDPAHVGVGSRFIVQILAPLYERLLKRYAKGHLLDVGCGFAPLYSVYRDKVDRVTLVDWPNTLHKSDFVDYEMDINQGLAVIPDDSFDTILATDVIEHLHKPQTFFAEVSRVLRCGGRLIVTVPFLYWIHEQPHDYFRYTASCLSQLCQEHSLEVEYLEPYGGAVEVILDMIAKLISRYPLLSRFHLWLAPRICGSSFGMKLRSKTQEDFPLGYGLVALKKEGLPQAQAAKPVGKLDY
jgi:SAM-dependent methyltransferase